MKRRRQASANVRSPRATPCLSLFLSFYKIRNVAKSLHDEVKKQVSLLYVLVTDIDMHEYIDIPIYRYGFRSARVSGVRVIRFAV